LDDQLIWGRAVGDKMTGRVEEFRTFEDLECWQACRDLRMWTSNVVRNQLPTDEKYRLGDQLIRASRSSTANIAEGYGRYHYQEIIQYCRHARGSVYEVLDHCITARDEALIDDDALAQCRELVHGAALLLNGYIKFLKARKASVTNSPISN